MARSTPVNSGYTIVNGAGTGINAERIDVWVEYKCGAENVVDNYTPFTAYFYAALNPSYTSTTQNVSGLNSTFNVDGKAGTSVTNGSYDFTSSSKVNLLGSYTGNITHGADGSKSVSITGSFTTLSSYISGGNISVTVELPKINRGLVSIDTGSKIVKAIPYIDTGSSMDRASAYVDNGSTIKLSV